MSSGNGGKIAFAKIGSLYRDVNTLNIWGNFVSETMEHKLDELEDGSINGRRDAPDSYKGVDHGQGDIVMEPNPNFIGHPLKAWFGTYVASTVCGATSTGANSGPFAGNAVTYHRFTPANSAFSDRSYLEPYNIGIYRDVGSAFIFKGSVFPTLKLEMQAGQIVKLTASVMGRQVDLIDPAALSALVASGGRPWLWDMASLEISTDTTTAALAADTSFEQITFTFDLPQEGVIALDGTKRYAEFAPNDFRRVKIEGTKSFRDLTDYAAFKAYEARRMRLTALNVNSLLLLGNPASADATGFLGYFGLRMHIPQMKFTSWGAPISGPNRLTAKFAAKAEWNSVAGFSTMMELVNIVTSTDYTSIY
jgi:hypothetical protein